MKFFQRCAALGTLFIGVLIVGQMACAQGADFSTRIYGNQPMGAIKYGLAGAAQGGDSHAYSKPHFVKGISDMGISCVRLESMTGSHFFKLYDPEKKQYDFTRLDAEIRAIRDSKAEIIANIFYTPEWLSSDPEGKRGTAYMAKPSDWNRWYKYVYDITKHCKQQHFNIKYWEIWNEPSGVWAFTDWPDGKSFYELYRVSAKAIKDADPKALVGGFGDNMNYPEHYANLASYLKQHPGVPFDFMTVHWYADWEKEALRKPNNFFTLTNGIHAMMEQALGKKLPIFVTEWNSDAGQGAGTTWDRAAYMGQAYYWLQESPATMSTFFRAEPYNGKNSSLAEMDGTWRYSGRVLKMFTMLPATRVNASMAPYDTTMLAAIDDHRIAAFVTRASDATIPTALELDFQLQRTKLSGDYTMTTYIEDNASTDKDGPLQPRDTVTGTTGGQDFVKTTITLQPKSVALVVVDFSKR